MLYPFRWWFFPLLLVDIYVSISIIGRNQCLDIRSSHIYYSVSWYYKKKNCRFTSLQLVHFLINDHWTLCLILPCLFRRQIRPKSLKSNLIPFLTYSGDWTDCHPIAHYTSKIHICSLNMNWMKRSQLFLF